MQFDPPSIGLYSTGISSPGGCQSIQRVASSHTAHTYSTEEYVDARLNREMFSRIYKGQALIPARTWQRSVHLLFLDRC